MPDGALVADPDGLNPGGFLRASLRFEHRIPAAAPQSMSSFWVSHILENPIGTATTKKAYLGARFSFRGYQQRNNGFTIHNVAVDASAETAAGVVTGSAQAINLQALHEAAQATRTIGTGNSALTLTAEGGESTRGEAGNDWKVKTEVVSPREVLVNTNNKTITIRTGTGAENTSEQVADMVNGSIPGVPSPAKSLVHATFGGDGSGAVVANGGFQNLQDGMNTDGKLVAGQAITSPRGNDPGAGYANSFGGVVIPEDTFDSYGYTANTNGFYPGFAAYAAKGKDDELDQGWHTAFFADDRTTTRLMWVPNYFTIEMPNFYLQYGQAGPVRAHDAMWLGLGTDIPYSPFHLSVWGGYPADARLENKDAQTEAADFAHLLFDGNGSDTAAAPVTLASITARIANVSPTAKDAELAFGAMRDNTFAVRWRLADGICSEGVAGGNKGGSSINTNSYWVAGQKLLYKDATTNGVKTSLGSAAAQPIASDAISYVSGVMVIDTQSGSADDLVTINGGAAGDKLKLRSTASGRAITVKSTGNIRCGGDIVLDHPDSVLSLRHNGTNWLRTAYCDNG